MKRPEATPTPDLKANIDVKSSSAKRTTVAIAEPIATMTELSAGLMTGQYVPLEPMQTGYRRDRQHEVLRGPKFYRSIPEPTRAEENLPSELYLG